MGSSWGNRLGVLLSLIARSHLILYGVIERFYLHTRNIFILLRLFRETMNTNIFKCN